MAVDHRDMIAFQEELERTLASVPDIGHYVPPEYLSGHYRDEYPNGLYVHFQLGHHTLERAKGKTLRTQETRLARKYLEELRKRKLDKFIK